MLNDFSPNLSIRVKLQENLATAVKIIHQSEEQQDKIITGKINHDQITMNTQCNENKQIKWPITGSRGIM